MTIGSLCLRIVFKSFVVLKIFDEVPSYPAHVNFVSKINHRWSKLVMRGVCVFFLSFFFSRLSEHSAKRHNSITQQLSLPGIRET